MYIITALVETENTHALLGVTAAGVQQQQEQAAAAFT